MRVMIEEPAENEAGGTNLHCGSRAAEGHSSGGNDPVELGLAIV